MSLILLVSVVSLVKADIELYQACICFKVYWIVIANVIHASCSYIHHLYVCVYAEVSLDLT